MISAPIVFTAAGSGGHVFAALATLKAFKKNYPTLSENILFIGSTLTMEGEKKQLPIEERLCARWQVPFKKIRMGKLQRRLSLHSIKLLFKIVLGFWDAWVLLHKLRPKVIAAFGGYVSLPVVIVGKILGAKVIIHEQTSSIGLTNKLLQPFADVVAVTYESSCGLFSKETVIVGSPTMEHIYTISTYDQLLSYLTREHSRLLEEPAYMAQLKWLAERKVKRQILLMSGGSQGSHFLNEQMRAILPELLKDYIVLMQVGENEWYKDYDSLVAYVKTLPADLAQFCIIRKFIYEEFGFLMKTADVFLGRSGANTVYQVGMNGLYAIFVPIPWVTHNEQFKNAKLLQERHLASILEQDKCTPEVLLTRIRKIMQLVKNRKFDTKDKGAQPAFTLDADVKMAQEISKLAV